MAKYIVTAAFRDKYTGRIYSPGSVEDFGAERAAEILALDAESPYIRRKDSDGAKKTGKGAGGEPAPSRDAANTPHTDGAKTPAASLPAGDAAPKKNMRSNDGQMSSGDVPENEKRGK
jgi:hypothetical protein